MGFLDGFLGGVVQQHQRIEDQNREDATNQRQLEQGMLQHLITSPDPEIKAHAVAGLLDSTNPNRKKGGFAGWLGEVANNPHMDKIRALVAHDNAVGGSIPADAAHTAGRLTAEGDPTSAAAIATSAAGTPPPAPEASASAAPASSAPPGSASGIPQTGASVQPKIGPMAGSTVANPSPNVMEPAAMSANSPTEVGSAPPAPTVAAPSGNGGPSEGVEEPAAPATPATPAAVLGKPTPTPAAGAPGSLGAPPASATKPGVAPSAVLGQPAQPVTPPARPDVFLSPEEQVRRDKTAGAQGDVEGIRAGLKAAGFTDEEIKQELKLHYGRGTGAGFAPTSIKGEAPDENGKFSPAFGILNKVTRQYEDPNGNPIPGFRPMGGAAQHFGVALEGVSQRLFGKPYAQLTQPQQNAAQVEVEKTVQRTATARGQGANEAKLDAPIGVVNATKYGVPANTTMRQLQERIPLSQADQDKVHGISTLEETLNDVDKLLPQVFPEVDPGIMGRVKTGFTLFGKSLGRDEDLTKLNAEIASVMPGIVKVNGVTQRLNQKEIDFAEKQMVNTSALYGDTLQSAQAKMEILRDLVGRVQGRTGPTSLPAPGTKGQIGAPPPAPGAPPAAARAPGAPAPQKAGTGAQAPAGAGFTMVGGVLYKDGKPY